jgi:hypothetical protein
VTRVRITSPISGTRAGLVEEWPPVGETIDVDDDEAADLVGAGLAEVVEKPKAEKATKATKKS